MNHYLGRTDFPYYLLLKNGIPEQSFKNTTQTGQLQAPTWEKVIFLDIQTCTFLYLARKGMPL
jgi:hypothetical protein